MNFKEWLSDCRVIKNRDLWMTYLCIAAAALCFGLVIGSEYK
jgi:hypothetical protein